MLTDAFSDAYVGIGIKYQTDGSVSNLRRLQAKTKVSTDTINDFLFVDDCVLNTTTKADMQHSVDKFSDACNNFDLNISTRKTEVMHQPAPGKPYVEPNITINGQQLNAVDKFAYLGSLHSRNVVIDDEVNARLAKASAAFGRLHKNVWNRRGITTKTKIKVYQAIVLIVLWPSFATVHKGAKACKTNRTAVAEECRQARKNRANNPTAATTIPCPHCHTLFRAQIDLTSHLRTHRARIPLPQDE